jgi:4-hydroxythreonine-4-phosphate dehydrogenase
MLVITSGDPLSVSVEALAPRLRPLAQKALGPVVVVGSAWQWRDQLGRGLLGDVPWTPVGGAWPEASARGLFFKDVAADGLGAKPAEILSSKERGELSVRALKALETLPGASAPHRRLAVVTAPIDKFAAAEAGFAHPGQTEYFEALWRAPAVMILAGPKLRVGLATNHLALADVTPAIARDRGAGVGAKLDLLIASLRTLFAVAAPRIGVAALNPHAGDGGLFGREDEQILRPQIDAARGRHPGVEIVGPLPADTVFHAAYTGRFDAVLAMYHDQGLGPLKTVHFDDAVNVSGGLPHLRVSPDHGPAKDQFLKGRASARSFEAALALATAHLAASRSGEPGGARG